MPTEAIPTRRRVTFPWLVGRLRACQSVEEYEQIIALLRSKRWSSLDEPSNFLGMMRALLPPHVQRQLEARHQ